MSKQPKTHRLIPVYVSRIDVHARADMKIEPHMKVELKGWPGRLAMARAALRTDTLILAPTKLDMSGAVGFGGQAPPTHIPEDAPTYRVETDRPDMYFGKAFTDDDLGPGSGFTNPPPGFYRVPGFPAMDSTGQLIRIGDRVRWRGNVYTVKGFGERRNVEDSARAVFFDEQQLTPGTAYEWQVDLVCRKENLRDGL